MLAYAVIACQSESVVHVAYGVWVCLWEPRPYRGFQSVAMCLVLAMFGVRMCPSYLLISFRSRTWSSFCWGPPNNLDPTRPFLWFPGDCFCCCLSDSHETSVFSKKSHPFFSRFARSWPVSHSSWICQSQRPLWQDVKIWRYNIYIYILYLLNFLFVFISSFYFEVFQNFVLDVLKLGKDWNHQNLIGLGCPGAVQSSLGLRQLDLRAGRIDG